MTVVKLNGSAIVATVPTNLSATTQSTVTVTLGGTADGN